MSGQTKMTQVFFEDAREGDRLPKIELDASYTKLILAVAATGDWFPSHHDPVYARKQGQKDIYLNTTFIAGFLDRIITDWAGPRTFILKRKFSMQKSIFAGDTVHGEGVVKGCRKDDEGNGLIDVDIMMSTQDGPCVPASATIMVPCRGER